MMDRYTACDEIIEQARKSGKWLHCAYNDLWFSPDELVTAQSEGRFRWGPCNWSLRDPRERRKQLAENVDRNEAALREFDAKLRGA